MMTAVVWILAVGAGLILLILLLVYRFQTQIIYPSSLPPGSRTHVELPSAHGMSYEDIALRSADDVRLTAYLIAASRESQAKDITLLYFHANAGNMGHRLPFIRKLRSVLTPFDPNIFLLSYRGYGLSDGSPDENGLRLDAQAALDFIIQSAMPTTKVVVMGASLGGAVAAYLACKNQEKVVFLTKNYQCE